MVRVRRRYEPVADHAGALQEGYARLVTALAERGWLDPDRAAVVLGGRRDD
jgi:hypothetical protein